MTKLSKALCFSFCFCILFSSAQSYDPAFFNCMKWRMVGPYRGGRTVGACGVPSQPNVFYIGVNNGGVWKTNDCGRTWNPVFDEQSTGSVGDVAVSPSNPQVIYAGSGEGIQRPDLSVGNGIYKSADGGKTWQNTGLADGLQIGGLAIDPANENRVFAAVLGHPYGPNTERGVFRTIDGGKTWVNVFFIDENTGAVQVTIDPRNSNTIYADFFAARQAPWENGGWEGKGSGLFKSTDGGSTWKKLARGLPGEKEGCGRIGFCVAPSDPNRLYAVVNSKKEGGIYRSNDAGESWTLMSDDIRFWDRGDDFAEIKTDPKNADIVYNVNVVVWKSADGGKTWNGFKGAPGGDDYHRLWINPVNPEIMLLAGDQGAIVTVNGGETWGTWYNQPTAQLYHISADNAFPYNLYSGQQESGSVGIDSRGNDGQITLRDWHPVGAEEYGYVVADPLNPNIIYGGKISRYDKRTGQAQDISPDPGQNKGYRFLRTAPMVFSTLNPHALYYAGNVVFKTYNEGHSWSVISPDLTRMSYDVAPSIGVYRTDSMKNMPRRGVVYTLALSPLDSNTLWAGTDDGLIQVTRDGGKNWTDVTPPALTAWSKISLMDASHSDAGAAYAAVNRIRLDDLHPHIYRTHDGGKTWKEIITGLPDDPIDVVKEDPLRKGLLFAGSEKAVYVSFDDGDHWQTLRLNMPASSVRDLIIKDNDLAVATHGRSFWILDDITPLRQLSEQTNKDKIILYAPEPAIRVRWNMNTDTPLAQEEPAGKNPPDGAVIDYYLSEKMNGPMTLEILDSTGKTVRRYRSDDVLAKIPDQNIPLYWLRPQQVLSTEAGAHRFLWDLHETPLKDFPSYPISAVVGETVPSASSPWVMPGKYTIRLTAGGTSRTQSLWVKMDPRVGTSHKGLEAQHGLSETCYTDLQQVLPALRGIDSLKTQLKALFPKTNGALQKSVSDFSLKLNTHSSKPGKRRKRNENTLDEALKAVFTSLEANDAMPTQQLSEAVEALHQESQELAEQITSIRKDLDVLNKQLKEAGLPVLILQ